MDYVMRRRSTVGGALENVLVTVTVTVKSRKDLGVMLTNELSPSVHISEITVSHITHQARRPSACKCNIAIFETRDRDLLVRAFVTYVRTLMEYNSVVWSPDLKRDIVAVGKVQRRFIKGHWTEETIL